MRINAVRSPIVVFAMLTAVFVPIMTSQGAVRGALGATDSASPSPSTSASADSVEQSPEVPQPSAESAGPPPVAPKQEHGHGHPHGSGPTPPTAAEAGAFYRSVLDLRPDIPGISDMQYYYIGQALCTHDDLGFDELSQVQNAFAMPAGTLAYDNSLVTTMLEAAPMEFIQENADSFGFDGSDMDATVLNAFRHKLCDNHRLWSAYADFVRGDLETLGPWETDPSYLGDSGQASALWRNDLSAWESALRPWLQHDLDAA